MKIHADKIEGPVRHALSIRAVRCILKAVPAEWVDELSEVHLSNSSAGAPRVFFSRYEKALTVHSRGATPSKALEMILLELAAVHLGYAMRHWHRLSSNERNIIEKVILPLMDELLPIVTPREKEFVHVPTSGFRHVI